MGRAWESAVAVGFVEELIDRIQQEKEDFNISSSDDGRAAFFESVGRVACELVNSKREEI